MHGIDEWHDWVRLIGFLICAPGFFYLLVQYHTKHDRWNTKTTDYWFALAVWTFTGAASSLEGILTDTDPGFRIMLILAGGLATLKAVLSKDSLSFDREA